MLGFRIPWTLLASSRKSLVLPRHGVRSMTQDELTARLAETVRMLRQAGTWRWSGGWCGVLKKGVV